MPLPVYRTVSKQARLSYLTGADKVAAERVILLSVDGDFSMRSLLYVGLATPVRPAPRVRRRLPRIALLSPPATAAAAPAPRATPSSSASHPNPS